MKLLYVTISGRGRWFEEEEEEEEDITLPVGEVGIPSEELKVRKKEGERGSEVHFSALPPSSSSWLERVSRVRSQDGGGGGRLYGRGRGGSGKEK